MQLTGQLFKCQAASVGDTAQTKCHTVEAMMMISNHGHVEWQSCAFHCLLIMVPQ